MTLRRIDDDDLITHRSDEVVRRFVEIMDREPITEAMPDPEYAVMPDCEHEATSVD